MTPSDLPDNLHQQAPEDGDGQEHGSLNLIHQSLNGPLPHPSILGGYDDVVPGSAERILRMAEKQLEHRIDTESLLAREQMHQATRGQHYALFICSLALVIAAGLAFSGHEVTASIIGGLDLIGLAAVFIAGKVFVRSSGEAEPEAPE
jgi:uncharacterized membrane protein